MKAGTIFITSSGQYSDYGIHGHWRAIKNFDFDAELASFAAAEYGLPPYKRYIGFSPTKLMQSLIDRGLVQEVYLSELHLGDYGDVPTEKFEKDSLSQNDERWVRACFDHEDCALHPDLGAACAHRTDTPKGTP